MKKIENLKEASCEIYYVAPPPILVCVKYKDKINRKRSCIFVGLCRVTEVIN